MRVILPTGVCVILLSVGFTAQAENWPGWRGPRGDGTSLESEIPITWNGETGENILWNVPIPGLGHSSPVVWEDRLFLTTCEEKSRLLLCLDRDTGETLWSRTVLEAPLETKHQFNSHASGTPATDGETVFVTFLQVDGRTIPAPNVGNERDVTPGQIVVAAYDFAGNRLWRVAVGEFVSAHGFCSCPVLYKDLVIVNGDHDGDSYLVALKKSTGEAVWKIPRKHKIRSYATPIIREIDGRTQMVLSGSQRITSYNPRNGKEHWAIEGPTEQFVASMVYDGRHFYMAAGFPTYHVLAIRPDGTGDVTDTHAAWHVTNARCYVPSPVLAGELLFVADDRGTVGAFDTETGERVWRDRLGPKFSASLVANKENVFFLAENGVTKVVRVDSEPRVVAENRLGEYCSASPAISGGRLFIRSERHLFCIGRDSESE